MEPREPMRSEQRLQMNMLCLNALEDVTLGDGGVSENEVVYNMIEVLSDEATFTAIHRYLPQTQDYAHDVNMTTLTGVHFGYFKNIVVDEGRIRLVRW